MIVYGRRAVREALRGRRRVQTVWAFGDVRREEWLADPGVEVVVTRSPHQLERIAGNERHQGVCAEVEEYPYASERDLLADPTGALIVALDQVQDPQNLGAVCRSAECAGATGVVVTRHRAAEVTPAVCSASAGAVEHLPVARVRNLADFLAAAKQTGCWCYGAQAGAGVAYDEPDYGSEGVVVVLGSEGAGLRPRVAAACDQLVSLPLRGRLESLNVASTAAVLLYEILQQRDEGLTGAP